MIFLTDVCLKKEFEIKKAVNQNLQIFTILTPTLSDFEFKMIQT